MAEYGNTDPTLPEKTLGVERIVEICKQFGLEDPAIKIVFTILNKWEGLVGETMAKAQIGIEQTSQSLQRKQILEAMMKTSMEFAEKRISDNHPPF